MMASPPGPPLQKHEYRGFTCYHQTHLAEARDLPVVVFLGGLMQDVRSWLRSAAYLNQYTTVIAIDPPGMGYSPALPSEYGFDFIADAVCSVLDELNLDRVAMGGASYGGVIAYRFAQQFPERLHSLVLGGTFTQLVNAWRIQGQFHLEKVRNNRLSDVASEVVSTLVCSNPDAEVARRKLVLRILKSHLSRMDGDQVIQYQANIERVLATDAMSMQSTPPVRSLLFTGEHDTFTTPSKMRELAGRFDDATFTAIHNADHISLLERFETIVELMRKFFANEPLVDIEGCSHPEYFGRANRRAPVPTAV